jgi:type II pantothenate kinase
MMAVFALRNETIKDVVITGSLAEFPQAKTVLQQFNAIKGLNFIIPENAVFATAIGATV